ncbi:hypothetical protein LIER_02739 [Lithospermum erythrorhizon]|uniref:Mini-chromosome maintenance complex-binding protein n=1 Tax=Lithospermum erythrorhizon TaxID=34254 RepID=A0AAV3NT62_LITER
MVGLPYDCLSNPLGAVRFAFDKALSSSDSAAALDGKDFGAADLFLRFLDNGGLLKVPLLNSKTIKWLQPNTLVRFRGMIQDMLGNEFYVGAYKDRDVWRTNKYADVSQSPMGSPSNSQIWERRLIYCTPVPGQNDWTEPSASCIHLETLGKEKRQRDEDAVMEDLSSQTEGFPCPKRMREGDTATPSSTIHGVPAEGISSMAMVPSDVDKENLSCLVKIYDSPESDLKLNDVFEFVGILTFDQDISMEKDNKDDPENTICEDLLVDLLPSKVPRIHCLVHRKLAQSDFLPGPVTLEPKPHLVKPIREALLGHLTTLLGNDGVAAQYMLLHLLSRVHARIDTVAVGKLALNLTSLTNESISVFKNRILCILKTLLPFTHDVPLTVELLNAGPLAPRKDYDSNRLLSGPLQLAEGSHLTIDETQLKAGSLDSTGIDNTRVLKSLLEWQKVDYDFTYYKVEMPADVQLLILSEGKSNILPADIVLPFCPSSVDSLGTPNAESLAAWRWYLATMRSLTHSIEPDMQKVLEDDLVAARQTDRSLGTQDFSRLLTMGRLLSISFGETCLSMEHWQMVKELERLRRERLQGRI